jgi:hypothetical protein
MPKEHQPWQPRIDRERELNPSVRSTEPQPELDPPSLDDIEQATEQSEAREGDAEPIKIPPDTAPPR